ncbi:hypothetical protein SPRG_11112 [Saprolegnia parasitica CBS 223.65]|uniref:Uncharacterized protein n=1 Tax=Saprolegnia parasitica (strain CBS 223.65) TaxID=695850 RepID=A0A067BYR9_SAPPC|nr:hypothetical protein SPRG_11112 [Saprolegnia parasitica CBS 223.65]KDO23664.1 hypothetical protein SPRG_11112 [Saprolegnia parasitica CBS 223.65]|eukprot:XP_012205647.1 hypothetical protein SPRG_11112 [Saprolegnia parasitica CBS 223.65]
MATTAASTSTSQIELTPTSPRLERGDRGACGDVASVQGNELRARFFADRPRRTLVSNANCEAFVTFLWQRKQL